MAPDLPIRKFAPEPVETTTRSSKAARQQSPEKDGKAKPRRFAVEPVETEHKSSKNTAKKDDGSMPRRFAPQLEATEQRSSKKEPVPEKPAHVKFSPQPVETIRRSNRKPQHVEEEQNAGETVEKKVPRKFAPILVDTAKRSRRAGETSPAVEQQYKTESNAHLLHAREHRRHIRGDRTPVGEEDEAVAPDAHNSNGTPGTSNIKNLPAELRRQLCPVDGTPGPRRESMASQRSHSFRMPELDTIASSESERDSNTTSLSSSPGQGSPITASDSSFNEVYKHATRIRESVDENFTHYLLQLEAKKAEQRLQEQALAAFPNSDFHEPVQHYVGRDDDSDDFEIEDRPTTYDLHDEDLLSEMAARRESTAKISWEQLEMQRHAEQLEEERNAAKTTAKQPSQSPWWKPPGVEHDERDKELRSMRDRARPPMLGADLTFPRCRSPEPARFDVTQGSAHLRTQMCYLSEHVEAERKSDEESGLWRGPEHDSTRDSKGSSTSTKSTAKGLWGGFCFDDGEHETPSGLLAPASGPTGLMTPYVDSNANPFEQSFAVPGNVSIQMGLGLKTPPTPTQRNGLQNSDLGRIDGVLSVEQDLDDVMRKEYPDSFITQVYNYLSLGYPSLARPFDEELAKISRIPIADLRQDDRKAKSSPRGYIRLGPDFEGGGGEGVNEDSCMRWQALKAYIREWARQEKNMVKVDGPGGNWGTGARRGSWAI